MGRRSVWKRPKRKHSEGKEPYEMLNRAKPLNNNNNSWAEEGQEKPKNEPVNQKEALRKPFWEEQSYKMQRRTTKSLWKRVLIEKGQAKSSKKQHSENTDKWHLRKAGSFSYGESPRTPPLEGTSLHWWNNSVERPWGILSLFTSAISLPQSATHVEYTPNSTLRREEP